MFETRIEALRADLKRRKLDGFLIPRADVHQGEEVAPCDARLEWLTGFTGSAGCALITLDVAHLFVDGRYTLQVIDQCPEPLFQHHSLIDTPPAKFITSDFGRIAYDPWLFTQGQLKAFKGDLVAVDPNPVDAIWTDRPAFKTGTIWAHPLEFSGEESADKRAKIAQKLPETASKSAFVFTLPDSIAWLLNIRGSDLATTPVVRSFSILHRDGSCAWYVDATKVPADAMSKGLSLKDPADFIEDVESFGGTLYLDPATAPSALFDLAHKAVPLADPVIMPKACKNEVELEGIRAAHRRDAGAVKNFIDWINTTAPTGSITELDAVTRLRGERERLNGFISDSFDTISGAGPNGAIVHYRVTPETNRELKSSELYLVDSGGQYVDGTTDITRTLCIGEPDEEQRRAYTLVLKGHIALAIARFPKGTTGQALDILARQFLWQAGMDYDHGTGHGVGACLNVHEGPARIAKSTGSPQVPLQPGMVLSNEPGYYKTDAFGIRLENLVVVRKCRAEAISDDREFYEFETLSFVPFEQKMIDSSLINELEKAWLDHYHSKCG